MLIPSQENIHSFDVYCVCFRNHGDIGWSRNSFKGGSTLTCME